MYKTFFAFRERPFKLVPDPEYYYLSKSHEEAMAHLTYALTQGDGFVEITGEVGTGKTMMCRVFLENLDEQTEAAYIFNPRLSPRQLLKTINAEFGIASDADDSKDLIDALNEYLMQKRVEGKRVILLIDEAQNLPRNVMEQLRLLSNLETNKSKLLQIILVGQPELGEALDAHELRQLSQRITLSCHLSPLTYTEVREYIEHRIHIASIRSPVQFTASAYRKIFRYSGGIPRLINIACDRALLAAFGRNQKKITGRIARNAIRELAGSSAIRRSGADILRHPVFLSAAACLFLLVLMVVGFQHTAVNPDVLIGKITDSGTRDHAGNGKAIAHPAPESGPERTVATTLSGNPVVGSQELLVFLRDMDVRKARHLSLARVVELWGKEPTIPPELDEITDDFHFFRQAARTNDLSVIRVGCDFELIRNLNLPAILEIRLPEYPGPGFLVVEGIDTAEISLSRARANQRIEAAIDAVRPYCSGNVYIPWQNLLPYNGVVPRKVPHESVIMLKIYLKEIGYDQIDISPHYDRETEKVVRQIQKKYGLATDGIVGPLTKIALFNEKKSLAGPRIADR
jgi:general secretion pathway protein A